MPTDENPHDQPADAVHAAADAGAARGNHAAPGVLQAISRASDQAVDQHLAEASAGKRGRGRPIIHGKYSAKLPVEDVGAGPAATPEAQAEAAVHPLGYTAPGEVFDEEAAEAMVEVGISGLNYLGGLIVRLIGGKEISDAAVIDAAVKNAQMPEDAKVHIKAGGVACMRKHGANLGYGPEMMLGMGVLMWGGVVGSQVKTLKEAGAKLRGQAQQ